MTADDEPPGCPVCKLAGRPILSKLLTEMARVIELQHQAMTGVRAQLELVTKDRDRFLSERNLARTERDALRADITAPSGRPTVLP